ncbi:hypothetical protein D3C84_680520 [compost metagenome]
MRMRSLTRVMASDRDQLMNCSVMKALLGTMISFLSQSTIVVARVLILVTVPVRSRMVTVSPSRIGFSNRMMRPETKFAKISCRPKPRPTESAATSHWVLDQSMPSMEKPVRAPMRITRYLLTVVRAKPVPGERLRCWSRVSSISPGRLRAVTTVRMKAKAVSIRSCRVMAESCSMPATLLLTCHTSMLLRKLKAELRSDHCTTTSMVKPSISRVRTRPRDWALMVSRSSSGSSTTSGISELKSSSSRSRWARISARLLLARSKARRRRWISIQRWAR